MDSFGGARSGIRPNHIGETSLSSGLRRQLGSRPTGLGLGPAGLTPPRRRIGLFRRHLPHRQRSISRSLPRRSHFAGVVHALARHARANRRSSAGSKPLRTVGVDGTKQHRTCTSSRSLLRIAGGNRLLDRTLAHEITENKRLSHRWGCTYFGHYAKKRHLCSAQIGLCRFVGLVQ